MRAGSKRRLADAAAREFLERGYADTALSSIAERIGLTKGAFAYHFPAKADLARHLLGVTVDAARKAEILSAEAYPDCGVRRLALHFMILAHWWTTEAQFAAGLALLSDTTSPIFADESVVRGWIDLAEMSFRVADQQGERVTAVSPGESADFLLASLFGAFLYRRFARSIQPGMLQLRYFTQAIIGCGVPTAEDILGEVVSAHAGSLPRLSPVGED